MDVVIFIYVTLFLFGGVFITSGHFMNIENDAKSYFIGVTVVLLLIVCSITRKGLFELGRTLRSSGICIGFSAVCLILSVYGLLNRGIPSCVKHDSLPFRAA